MSRIGKQPIKILEKTEVKISDGVVIVKGPLGELSRELNPEITVKIENDLVTVTPNSETVFARALWGTFNSHISNMIQGVNKLFEKKLIIEGVGFKSEVKGNILEMRLGFSHPVEMEFSKDSVVTAEKNVISISGADKEKVGQFAAKVRSKKKPEPYKGKGIHYEGEVIRRKQGKKNV
jgi:large subunit ribosomal protein L6